MAIQWIKFKDSLHIKIARDMGGFAHPKPTVIPIVYDQRGRLYPSVNLADQLDPGMEVGFYAYFKIIGQDYWTRPRWYCISIVFKEDQYCWVISNKRMCNQERHNRYFKHPPWLTIGDRNLLYEFGTGVVLNKELENEPEQI